MKNKNQIIPLAIGLLFLAVSYALASSVSAVDSGKGDFSQRQAMGKSLPLSTADTAEDEHICGLSSVLCPGEDTSVADQWRPDSLQAGVSLSGQIISFYSAIDSCHTGVSCLMANGKKAQIGYVACPRRYKLGTKVRIDGKAYECGDRTAKWVDGRWDIFTGYGVEAYHLALQNGLKTKIVEIL